MEKWKSLTLMTYSQTFELFKDSLRARKLGFEGEVVRSLRTVEHSEDNRSKGSGKIGLDHFIIESRNTVGRVSERTTPKSSSDYGVVPLFIRAQQLIEDAPFHDRLDLLFVLRGIISSCIARIFMWG